MKDSGDSVYRRLSEKIDLFPNVPEVLQAMLAGSHVFVDSTTFSVGIIKYEFGVSLAGFDRILLM